MGVAATLLLAANIVYATSYVVTRLVLDDVPPMTLALLRRRARPARAAGSDRSHPTGAHAGAGRARLLDGRARLRRGLRALALGHRALVGDQCRPAHRRRAAHAGRARPAAPRRAAHAARGGGRGARGRRRGPRRPQRRAGRHARDPAALARRCPAHPVRHRLRLVFAAGPHGADRHERHRDHRAVDRLGHAGDGAALVWNWALARVEASRAAPFLTVQPVVGALLGAVVLGEAVTRFTALGGVLV